jgi:hypothetical protein
VRGEAPKGLDAPAACSPSCLARYRFTRVCSSSSATATSSHAATRSSSCGPCPYRVKPHQRASLTLPSRPRDGGVALQPTHLLPVVVRAARGHVRLPHGAVSTARAIPSLAPPKCCFRLPCEPTRSTLNIIWSCGLFEGKGVSNSRVSPPGPLSISYGHVGCLKARAFPPPV